MVTNTGGEYLYDESLTNADETLTNADESLNESPYAFLTEHFSLCSFYSLPLGTNVVFDSPENMTPRHKNHGGS